MRHLKIALTGLAIAGVATGSFLRWQTSSSHMESHALQLYLKGNGQQAYENLAILEQHVHPAYLLLLQGYTLRDSDHLSRSSQRLLQGIRILQENEKKLTQKENKLLFELGINLALNGYLSHDSTLFDQGMKSASHIDPKNGWIFAMQALKAQQNRDFVHASLEADKATGRVWLSPWMEKSFGTLFGNYWDSIVHARAMIEKGQTIQAREMISKIPTDLDSTRDFIKLLSALMQIKDGQSRPIELSLPYFQVAWANLKTIPLNSPVLMGDFGEVAEAFGNQGEACLKASLFDGVDFFISALSFWHDKERLTPLANNYIQWIANQEIETTALPKSSGDAQLHALINNPEWSELLQKTLIQRLYQTLDEKRWETVQRFWTTTIASKDNGRKVIESLDKAMESYVQLKVEKILLEVMKTGSETPLDEAKRDLSQLFPLLAQMEPDSKSYQLFLEKLFDETAETLLHSHNPIQSGGQILNVLLTCTSAPLPDQLRTIIKEKVSRRFVQARAAHDTKVMIALADLTEQTGVEALPTYNPEALSNMFADARYLLESDQIAKGQDQLHWILRLDPQNTSARLLLGSSYFAAGNYAQAANLLEKMDSPSSEMRQLLAICYLRSGKGDRAVELIQQLRQQGALLSERLLLESGLYLIDSKKWREAVEQLSQIKHKTADIRIYLLAAFYRLDESKGVWQEFNQLPSALRANPELASLALRSIADLQFTAIANEVIDKAMHTAVDRSQISQLAKEFLSKNFEPFELDLSLTSAHYLQNTKQDPARALSLLDKSPTNDWRIMTERALSLLQLGLPAQAKAELIQAGSLAQDEEHLPYWIALIQCERQQSNFLQVATLLGKLEKSIGVNRVIELERAHLYVDSSRFDLAISTLEALKIDSLTLDMSLLYLDCLVKTGKVEASLLHASQLTKRDHSAWTLWCTHCMIYPSERAKSAISQMPSKNLFDLLKPDQKAFVLKNLLARSESKRAQAWAQNCVSELQGSFYGKLVCLELALADKRMDEAKRQIEQLITWQGKSLSETLELISLLEHSCNKSAIEALAQTLEASMPLNYQKLQDHEAIDPQMAQSMLEPFGQRIASLAAYLAVAKQEREQRGLLSRSHQQGINRARLLLRAIEGAESPLVIYSLSAKASELLNDPSSCEQEVSRALAINPSDIEVCLLLCDLLIDAKAPDVASEWLRRSLALNPENPWLELALATNQFTAYRDSLAPNQLIPGAQGQEGALKPILTQLQHCLAKAPYLIKAHLLSARIAILEQQWPQAYLDLSVAYELDPNDRDLLSLFAATLQARLRLEGPNPEWQEKLQLIEGKLSKNML